MATTTSVSSDGDDSRQSWDLTNPICLSTISKRKSAFLPYKPNTASPPAIASNHQLRPASASGAQSSAAAGNSGVLTNLQRGNTEAHCGTDIIALSFHERCGQGEVTADQVGDDSR